jgi:RimJ/RimL family protein N-acetyltransferase
MLHGERVTLRPVRAEELPSVYAWRFDVETFLLTETEPYVVPTYEKWLEAWTKQEQGSWASFGVDADGRLVGLASLWGIDLHNGVAHVGLSIGSKTHRGQGLGRDALAVITDYGFRLRGLHRLQLETLAANEAMVRTARSVGYHEEGRLRQSAFVSGSYVDEILFGLLSCEWHGKGE